MKMKPRGSFLNFPAFETASPLTFARRAQEEIVTVAGEEQTKADDSSGF